MPIDLDLYSRFAQTETIFVDGNEVFGRWAMPDVLKRELYPSDLRTIIVTSDMEGRPDRLSKSLYNTTQLDWLIIALNGVSDALNWPRAGDVIKVLNPSVAIAELL